MLSQAFDNYSTTYDEHFTNTPIGRLQRKRVYSYLKPLLNKRQNVLELNCGTGEDAGYISKYVQSVDATDQSEGMIETARIKCKQPNVKFSVCSIQNIKSVVTNKSYDIIFSDFGGINCISPSTIKKCGKDLYELSNENSSLALVIMGRKCIWEKLYFFSKRKMWKALRRLSPCGVFTYIGEEAFTTYYYSPTEVSRLLKKYFEVQYYRPVGIFIPPSYLNSFFSNKLWLLNFLNFLEKIAGRLSFLSNYADHYLIVLKKKTEV